MSMFFFFFSFQKSHYNQSWIETSENETGLLYSLRMKTDWIILNFLEMTRMCSILQKGNFVRRLVFLITFLYITVTALFFCSSQTVRNNNNNNNIRDREVLLGKFLLEEKSSNFSFETFQKYVAASLPTDEFKIKLEPGLNYFFISL